MKIKCCGQSKGRKVNPILTELEAVIEKVLAGKSVLGQLGVTKRVLSSLTPTELKSLLDLLHTATSDAMTRLEELDGLKTSGGATDTHHKSITVNMPGVGDCQYTGD